MVSMIAKKNEITLEIYTKINLVLKIVQAIKKTFSLNEFYPQIRIFKKNVWFFHADIGLYFPSKTTKKRPMYFLTIFQFTPNREL